MNESKTNIAWISVYESLPTSRDGEELTPVIVLIDELVYSAKFDPTSGWIILARQIQAPYEMPQVQKVTLWSYYNGK